MYVPGTFYLGCITVELQVQVYFVNAMQDIITS